MATPLPLPPPPSKHIPQTNTKPILKSIMKEVLIHPDLRAEIVESPIPKPAADQLVIKVVVSGANPKDWKVTPRALNQGEDMAGIVYEVGMNITEFKVREDAMIHYIYIYISYHLQHITYLLTYLLVNQQPGDRVCAFHEMHSPHGSYAEYAVAWGHTTFHLPDRISFEGNPQS